MNTLKKIRKEKGFTQKSIAKKMGVSVATVSRWESGIFYPRANKLAKLSKVLKCSINDLIEKENPA